MVWLALGCAAFAGARAIGGRSTRHLYDAGAAAATLVPREDPDVPPDLCYTARDARGAGWLFVRPLTASGPGAPLFTPSAARTCDFGGAMAAQCTAPNRLYYIGIDGRSRRPAVCAAERTGEQWTPRAEPILAGTAGTWDAGGIVWVSVVAPGGIRTQWALWYVGATSGGSEVGYAESEDGLRWRKAAAPVYQALAGARVLSVSVIPYLGGLRAWLVEAPTAGSPGELLTAPAFSADGSIGDVPEPVAWQAPELRFGNLPKDAIPIRDARAAPMGDDPRHVRLYVTTLGMDGRERVSVAENFPVNGERRPTIFARHAKPLAAPGPAAVEAGPNGAWAATGWLALVAGAAASLLTLLTGRSRGADVETGDAEDPASAASCQSDTLTEP